MHSTKIQQLLNISPIRPPSKHEKCKRDLSSSSQKLLSRVSTKVLLPVPTETSSKTSKSKNVFKIREEYDPCDDEKVDINLPQTNFNGSDRQSPKFCIIALNIVKVSL